MAEGKAEGLDNEIKIIHQTDRVGLDRGCTLGRPWCVWGFVFPQCFP